MSRKISNSFIFLFEPGKFPVCLEKIQEESRQNDQQYRNHHIDFAIGTHGISHLWFFIAQAVLSLHKTNRKDSGNTEE